MSDTTRQRHDSDTATRWRRVAPTVALVVPLILVNLAAVYGQAGWAHDNITDTTWTPATRWSVATLFAVTVESVGVYLAVEAHTALMAGDASARLRLGSYAVGALVGALNFAHFATQPGYQPNPLAVTFGLLSSISPWLWAIRSRSLNRDRLRDLGQIDPRAVRFAPLRWTLYPSATWRAFRAAVWAGVVVPADAVALVSQPVVAVATSPKPRSAASQAPPPSLAPPAGTTVATGDTTKRPAPSRGRGGGDNVAQRARNLWAPGKSVAEILLALGLPATPANRRKVERATQRQRQGGGADVAN